MLLAVDVAAEIPGELNQSSDEEEEETVDDDIILCEPAVVGIVRFACCCCCCCCCNPSRCRVAAVVEKDEVVGAPVAEVAAEL